MKKRGFTLIELMIVLAIIAILAVVIVPKSGIFKKNAKTAGVTTNMNTVRAYLETKTGDNALDDDDELLKAMSKSFDKKGTDAIVNPRDKSAVNIKTTTPTTTTSVLILTYEPDESYTNDSYKGTVIIYVGNYDVGTDGALTISNTGKKSGYIVYGIDLDGNLLGSKYAIEK